jgi:hypothetical protein
VLPALTVLVNVTWLGDHYRWETCFTQRLAVIDRLIEKVSGEPPAAPVQAPDGSAVASKPVAPPAFGLHGESARRPQSWGHFLMVYVRKLVEAVDPFYGLLILIGLVRFRSIALRKDQLSIHAFNAATLGLVLAFWFLTQEIQGRYFFPLLLVALPYGAGGLLALAEVLTSLAARWKPTMPLKLAAVNTALLVVLCVACTADALTNKFHDRRERRDLGQWVHEAIGPNQKIVGPEPGSMILAYYARSQFVRLPLEAIESPEFPETLDAHATQVVIIPAYRGSADTPWRHHFLSDPRLCKKFHEVPPELLPASVNSTVLVRTPAWEQLASRRERLD